MRIEDSWLALSTAEVSFDVYLLRCLLTAVYENIKKSASETETLFSLQKLIV